MAAGEDAGAKLDLIAQAIEEQAPVWTALGEGRYRWEVPAARTVFEVDYLRREKGVLYGEVLVRCDLPGAVRGVGDVLAVDNLNLASTRTRKSFGRYLEERAKVEDLDYVGLVEELAQRVLAAEREGEPAVWLHEVPPPKPEGELIIGGLPVLERNPMILFGDGGTAKSYLALWLAGKLAAQGLTVALFDWELTPGDHRLRLGELFGGSMPWILYSRCSLPLHQEAARVRNLIREHGVDFAIFDSVAYACDGPPESSDVAMRYFQAMRRFGEMGSIHVAHTTKNGEHSDRRPFGSTFWFNSARGCWNVKLSSGEPGDRSIVVGLYDRKQTFGAKRRAVGFRFTFGDGETTVIPADLADVDELAANLSIGERLRLTLRRGPRTREELREELDDVAAGTLRKEINRAKERGVLVEIGDRVSLKSRQEEAGQ